MTPTLVLLQPGLPSSSALVAQLSCASQGRACTSFHCNQVVRALPPARRFLVARLLADRVRQDHGLEFRGYSTEVGLVLNPALAPDVQLSLHPAPTSRFPWVGDPGAWRLATSRRIARRVISSGFGGLAARPCMRLTCMGGPPRRPGSDCRTRSSSTPCLW